jgi:predicted metal-binding membrane protein
MLLLFVGGVMNLLWIAGLTALVLLGREARGSACPSVSC